MALAACCFTPVAETDGGAASISGSTKASGSSGTTGGTSGGGSTNTSSGASSSGPPKPAAVMIVQDLSGSMCQPIQATDPAGASCLGTTGTLTTGYCSNCFSGAGACSDPVNCASQLQQAASTLTSVLNSLDPASGQLSLGLASFPSSTSQCGTGSVEVSVGDAVGTIPRIIQFYGGAAPSGGGPLAATLAVAATDPLMANPDPTARKFILLVTNGWPNCAASSPCATEDWSNGQPLGCASPAVVAAAGITASPPAGCTCSFGNCTDISTLASCCPIAPAAQSSLYCLDEQNSASELATLYSTLNITTFVVAVGFAYGGNPTVLNELAAAGHGSASPLQANDPAALQALLATLIAGGS